ncbi:hypothetical protein [Anaerococcus lactolyticus]|uniref:Uncharacterized protein n=1 Tax=Anaerococcus lactolyticus S7-1-13 TaxID=1284686 RepID=A0A095YDI3_9FIRM|nr:hypothetical protein [Anaerococcus lactolyticus]KGF04652.1 hypothetical protein HMPREF1630_03215 [Anaerococcus lactolyticus S7-1-13]
MRYIDKKKFYIGTLLIGLSVLTLSFIFRYSYINFFGFDRPLKLACILCAILGTLGAILAIIDGVNKNFRNGILLIGILNLIMALAYPILLTTEKALEPTKNPYETTAPDKGYSTKFKRDASFIIEGELYKFPLRLSDFTKHGFTYALKEKDNHLVATISRVGDSYDPKPTWFTDGVNNEVYREFYLLEAIYDLSEDKEKIENAQIKELSASVINNNRDFEIMGIKLEDSIYDIKQTFPKELIEDKNNKQATIKIYYLKTSDGHTIRLNAHNGTVQSIDIY